jgi:hypothetical protein
VHVLIIPVPLYSTAQSHQEHINFQTILLGIAGGFTKHATAEGTWRDPVTSDVHIDRVVPYEIWVGSLDDAEGILREAARCFPTELAFGTVFDGDAEITARGEIWKATTPISHARRVAARAEANASWDNTADPNHPDHDA